MIKLSIEERRPKKKKKKRRRDGEKSSPNSHKQKELKAIDDVGLDNFGPGEKFLLYRIKCLIIFLAQK